MGRNERLIGGPAGERLLAPGNEAFARGAIEAGVQLATGYPGTPSTEIRWTQPEGGIFLWVTLPAGQDAGQLFDRALVHKVVFVPENNYFAIGGGENTMRLNFSAYLPGTIKEGVERLAAAIG